MIIRNLSEDIDLKSCSQCTYSIALFFLSRCDIKSPLFRFSLSFTVLYFLRFFAASYFQKGCVNQASSSALIFFFIVVHVT
uniref:Uncharacterized protein n=1 Tax=Rhipicephalus zambeziensis TaxID=60191 RepID=A0A224YCI4_9ACAR